MCFVRQDAQILCAKMRTLSPQFFALFLCAKMRKNWCAVNANHFFPLKRLKSLRRDAPIKFAFTAHEFFFKNISLYGARIL
jgi:hypothetical protein